MNTATELTQEQEDRLFDEYDAAMNRGDFRAAWEIGRKVPIHQALVPFVKKHYSPAKIRELGLIMPETAD